MAQTNPPTARIDDELADKVDVFGVESGENGFAELVEEALSRVRGNIADNREYAERNGMGDLQMSVDDVLSPENVRSVDVRNPTWEDPIIRVWLKTCPMWANDARNGKLIRTDGRRDLHFTFDSREF